MPDAFLPQSRRVKAKPAAAKPIARLAYSRRSEGPPLYAPLDLIRKCGNGAAPLSFEGLLTS